MSDTDHLRLHYLEKDQAKMEKRIAELERKLNQHATTLYHLWQADEAMRNGVFGNNGLTEH